ncbi:GUN4 domain-containing protein [Anabaena sp. CCY 0017]|uniref:GUN4 domain-containing protein n=1 Tax=Anabaena sp. CCY 0017 TaxID=3103866 RepID=UPI0039C613D1
MVTGEVPTPATVRVISALASPQEINPQISDRLNQAILQGMELKPEDRPQSIGEWFILLGLKSGNVSTQRQANPGTNSTQPTQKIGNLTPSLIIKTGIDYSKLSGHLSAAADIYADKTRRKYNREGNAKWRDADLETRIILLKLANKQQEGYLTTDDLRTIPAQDLQNINTLWLEYSQERFGFSIQS